jgi:hypothetical protein
MRAALECYGLTRRDTEYQLDVVKRPRVEDD